MTGSRLRVDPIACDGRGLCAEVLPEMITLDDWGFPVLRDAEVPPVLLDEAAEAVRLCPRLALRLDHPPGTPGASRRGRLIKVRTIASARPPCRGMG